MSKYLVSAEEFKSIIEEGNLTVVDFSSPYCAPCKKVPPIMEELEAEFGDKVKFIEINVAEENELALEYDVFSVPTIIIFNGGKEKERISGVPNRKKLASVLQNNIS